MKVSLMLLTLLACHLTDEETMSHKENLSVSNAKHKSVVLLTMQPDFLSLRLSLLYHNCLYIVYNCFILFTEKKPAFGNGLLLKTVYNKC